MRYTLKGTTPAENRGTLIAASSGTVSITTGGTVLKAVAFKTGWITSAVKSTTYTATPIDPPPGSTPPPDGADGPGSGSNYILASYQTGGDTGTVSSASAVSPHTTTTAPTTTSSTTPLNVYLYAGDQIIENVTMGHFYYQDSLGNTSHVSDAVGNLLERYTYSAFGTPTFYNAAGAIIYDAAGISQSALGARTYSKASSGPRKPD